MIRAALAVMLAATACDARPDVCVDDVSDVPTALTPHPGAGLLAYGHSHNDFEQARPLEDALAAGLHSVEADVFYADGRFDVSHDAGAARGTLAELYLDPLQARVDATGDVLGDGAPFTLWIDLKDGDGALAGALAALLAPYPMLATFGDGGAPGPVTVIVTGDAAGKEAFAALPPPRPGVRDDNDFDPDDPPAGDGWTAYALAWPDYLTWDGRGELPASESRRLACIVNRAHALGRRVRFWDAPDRAEVWRAAIDHGVDFIHTDRPADLGAFLADE